MKKLLSMLVLLTSTLTSSLYSMGCESITQRQFRQLAENSLLTMVAKGQVTVKMLVHELEEYQTAFEEIKKLAQQHGYQEITQYITRFNNTMQEDMTEEHVNMEDESENEMD